MNGGYLFVIGGLVVVELEFLLLLVLLHGLLLPLLGLGALFGRMGFRLVTL